MTSGDLQKWLERYRQAWETRDASAAAALFTDDATYYETPFGRPARGKEGVHAYWSAVTANHRDVKFSYEILSVSGDTCIALWQAEFRRTPSGLKTLLDGIFLLEFDAKGSCRKLREWWHKSEAPTAGGPEKEGET